MSLDSAVTMVKNNLQKNGFPQDTVSFPSAQLASFCHKQDISLSNLLEALEKEGINNNFVDDRIQFSAATTASSSQGSRNPYQIIQDLAGDLDLEKLREKFGNDPNKKPSFMEIMSALGPKKMLELTNKFKKLSAEEKQSLLDFAKSMGFTPPGGK